MRLTMTVSTLPVVAFQPPLAHGPPFGDSNRQILRQPWIAWCYLPPPQKDLSLIFLRRRATKKATAPSKARKETKEGVRAAPGHEQTHVPQTQRQQEQCASHPPRHGRPPTFLGCFPLASRRTRTDAKNVRGWERGRSAAAGRQDVQRILPALILPLLEGTFRK